MLKFLILALVVYLLVRSLKSKPSADETLQGTASDGGQIDDVMVQDPVCSIYIPRQNGIHLRHTGNDYYFCSPECRDKFTANH